MDCYFKNEGITEPVTLAQVKNLLGIDFDWKNDEISLMITAAREQAESYTNMSLVAKTLVVLLDGAFSELSIPHPPLVNVIKATAYDDTSAEKAIDKSCFNVYSAGNSKGIVELKNNATLPNKLRSRQGLIIELSVGYKQGECPAAFKDAICLYAQNTYDRIPFDDWKNSFYSLLQKWRIIEI